MNTMAKATPTSFPQKCIRIYWELVAVEDPDVEYIWVNVCNGQLIRTWRKNREKLWIP